MVKLGKSSDRIFFRLTPKCAGALMPTLQPLVYQPLELIPAVAAHSVQFLVLNPQNYPDLNSTEAVRHRFGQRQVLCYKMVLRRALANFISKRIFSHPESRQTGDGR